MFLVFLPSVSYDVETEEIKVDTAIKTPLPVHGLPIATSFAVYQQLSRYLKLQRTQNIKFSKKIY